MAEHKLETLHENSRDVQENFSTLPVGEILRRVRLQLGLSLEQVEQDIRIVVAYLSALEKGDFERLPAPVYVIGFVRTYSEYLNLDSTKMIQLLKAQTGTVRVERPKIFPVTKQEQRLPSRRVTIISGVIFVLIIIGWNISQHNPASDEIPPLPKDLARQMTAPQKPAPAKTQAAAPAEAKAKAHPVVLKAVHDVWLEIRDEKNQPVFSRVLKKGEEYWVPAEAVNYRMTTGNAGGLQIVVEGEALPIMGEIGDVKRRVSLNPADLKASLPSKAVSQ